MTDHSLELSVIESILGERSGNCGCDYCLGHWTPNLHEIMIVTGGDGIYYLEQKPSSGLIKNITGGDFEHIISKISDPEFRKKL